MKERFSFKYNDCLYTQENLKDGKILLDEGVSVTLKKKEISEYDASWWYLEFENTSGKDSCIFSDINDCDTNIVIEEDEGKKSGYMPTKNNIFVTAMNGMVPGHFYASDDETSSTEYKLYDVYLYKDNTTSFKNTGFRSSEGTAPFFDIHAKGSGVMLAIGWTGGWKADFTKGEHGVNVKTGLVKARFYLKDGEKLRTSSVLVMEYTKDEDKYNKFRRLIGKHFSHKTKKPHLKDGLLACELWGGLPSGEMIKRINEFASHGINFEEYWLDAGWYGDCTKCDNPFDGDWWINVGDWKINKRVHPNELQDVKKAANEAGAKIMLWFEIERGMTNVSIYKEHPDWFIDDHYPGGKSKILYLGNKDALEYAKNLLADYAEKLDLSCYRQDFNTDLTKYFECTDEENRTGITEIKHIMGMYEMWDYINEKFPDIIIDNCSSGGRRIDIETLSRSIPFFRSDYQCEFNANGDVEQAHNANISRYLPFNGCTTKSDINTYDVRSTYSSSWGAAYYNAVFQSMDEEKFKKAKVLFDEYVRIRPYLSKDFYNHGADVFDETSWAIFQYHDPQKNAGVILAFRRKNSPFKNAEITLGGAKDNKIYKFFNFDTKETFESGKNVTLTINNKRESIIIEYSE